MRRLGALQKNREVGGGVLLVVHVFLTRGQKIVAAYQITSKH